MRLRDFIALVFALFIAVGVVVFVRMLLGNREAQQPAVEAVQFNEILVSSRDIGVGETVSPDMFSWQRWPAEAVSPAHITKNNFDPNAYVGSIVQRRILKSEPITKEDFVNLGDRSALSATITPGMRAVSIPVDAASTNAGLIKPGDLVDVVTTESQGGDFQAVVGRTILEKIKVLAVDHHIDMKASKEGDESYIPKTVALEVTPNQAEVLAASVRSGGNLFLSLYSVATLIEPTVENVAGLDTQAPLAPGPETSSEGEAIYYNPQIPEDQKQGQSEIRIMRGPDKDFL